MKIISIYPNFANHGGAQDMALLLASRLNEDFPIVLSENTNDKIANIYKDRAIFLPFSIKTIFSLAAKDTVFLSHHRKLTTFLMLYKILLLFVGKNLNVVHVAHNTFSNLRIFTIFPKHIIAVSNEVKRCLISYFSITPEKVSVIYNGLSDTNFNKKKRTYDGKIKILVAGRICPVKQQVNIAKHLKGKLLPHIHIYFAGVGEDYDRLKEETADSSQFHCLGHISMSENLINYDYVCLFSKKEGFPLALIEGCMFEKPLITNNIPSVLEINKDGANGFVASDFDSLVLRLNTIPSPETQEYIAMALESRKIYNEKFRAEIMIDKYNNYLNNIIHNKV